MNECVVPFGSRHGDAVGVGKVEDRTKLSVKLFDLNNPPAGVYEGYAYIKQTPLAHIVAVVVP